MTRKKVKLAFITNDSARKATFKKRKKGLMKKVSELSTLCGIDACAIIYSPYESQPEVWPSTLGVQRVLAQFKRMPEMEQSKKMVNQESFIRQRITKANEQLKKQHKDNREKEMTEVMYQCLTGRGLQSLAMPDLHDLGWLIDQNLKEIYRKIESLKKSSLSSALPPPPLPPSPHPHPHPHHHHHHPQVVGAPRNMSGGNVDHVVMGEINGHDQKLVVDQLMMNGADVAMQRPQWFAERMMMNNNEPMGFGGDEMMLPFGDNHNAMWSSAFFP